MQRGHRNGWASQHLGKRKEKSGRTENTSFWAPQKGAFWKGNPSKKSGKSRLVKILLLTWPMAKRLKLLGITYLVGKTSRSNFFCQGPGRLSEIVIWPDFRWVARCPQAGMRQFSPYFSRIMTLQLFVSWLSHFPVIVTTRSFTLLVGDPSLNRLIYHKKTGKEEQPNTYIPFHQACFCKLRS